MTEHDPARTLIFHSTARRVVYFGAFRFDLADGLLSRAGEEIPLPPRALLILQYLIERAGRVVPKQALMDAAWKDAYVSETSLTEAIGLIRQALADDPRKPEYIQTVHRRGYRFVAPISTESSATQAPFSDRVHQIVPEATTSEASEPPSAAERQAGRLPSPIVLAVSIAVSVLAVGGLAWLTLRGTAAEPVVRVSLTLPPGQAPAPGLNAHPVATISPDGKQIVYVAGTPGATRLFVRRMDSFEATPLPGTDGAHGPFFSPDGQWIGFFADGSVKKIRLAGGEPQMLCATPTGVGGTWLSNDAIVFAPDWIGPLMRVSTSGGRAEIAARPQPGFSYRWPDRADGHTLIVTRWRSSARDAAVVAVSLESGAEQTIAEHAMFGRYVPTGAVVFVRDGDVHAVRVDPSTYAPRSGSARVLPSVLTGMTGAAQLAIAPNGTVLYLPEMAERSQRILARVDRQGHSEDLPIAPRAFRNLAICGPRLAVTIYDHGQSDLWTGHLDRAALTRITEEGSVVEPVWSADCRSLAFAWNRTGVANLHVLRLDSGGAPQLVAASRLPQTPGSWSRDGHWLTYIENKSRTLSDIWLLDVSTSRSKVFEETPAQELLPRLSPDGRWIAYESDASGQFQVEVASVTRGTRVQVSPSGGIWPAWSADGDQLFFLNEQTIFSVSLTERDGELIAGDPVPIFSHPDLLLFRPTGDQFIWLRRTAEHLPLTRMNLVLGWFSELDRQLP